MITKQLQVLLIEDDRIEIMKLNRVIESSNKHYITVANNGKEALAKLKNNIPDIILLDLNMPDTNGIEFLEVLKNDEKIKHIPTIILTTSNNKKDIKECYKIGIAGYILKPLKYDDYEDKIKTTLKYWSLNEFKI